MVLVPNQVNDKNLDRCLVRLELAEPDLVQGVQDAMPDRLFKVRLAKPDANLVVLEDVKAKDKDVAGTEHNSTSLGNSPGSKLHAAAFTNQSAPKNGRLQGG